jgi:formylglycine-generating enzyme required for sulfatase activity
VVSLHQYAIDRTPVTNAQYLEFLERTQYRPTNAGNFLKHWIDSRPPAGLEDHPVVYVNLHEARAYAQWAEKRLPTEEEWQYAAAGPHALRFPWGNEMDSRLCNGGASGGTTPVKAFPDGRSPFGCYDMCGNTWEWTESERSDGRTRFSMLRGGSYFHAKGSEWYFDGGPQSCSFSAKLVLFSPESDRFATIGFRCAA